jgi:hypothetical protein
MKIAKGIKIHGPERKSGRASPQRARGHISLGYRTNTKGKPKVQLPTKVAPKEENDEMLETKKVA